MGALAEIFTSVPPAFHENIKFLLKKASDHAYNNLVGIRGLKPIKGSGAMYMMINIDMTQFKDIEDDVDFAVKMMNEECVLLFPGYCFFTKNAFRIVY